MSGKMTISNVVQLRNLFIRLRKAILENDFDTARFYNNFLFSYNLCLLDSRIIDFIQYNSINNAVEKLTAKYFKNVSEKVSV